MVSGIELAERTKVVSLAAAAAFRTLSCPLSYKLELSYQIYFPSAESQRWSRKKCDLNVPLDSFSISSSVLCGPGAEPCLQGRIPRLLCHLAAREAGRYGGTGAHRTALSLERFFQHGSLCPMAQLPLDRSAMVTS